MQTEKFIRRHHVQAITGLPRSTLYDMIARREFPSPVPLGQKSVAWIESEVTAWQQQRIAARKAA